MDGTRTCACGEKHLPPTDRDLVATIRPGVSEQHGPLSCERIALGEQPKPLVVQRPVMRGWGRKRREVMEDRTILLPRAVRFERLDQR